MREILAGLAATLTAAFLFVLCIVLYGVFFADSGGEQLGHPRNAQALLNEEQALIKEGKCHYLERPEDIDPKGGFVFQDPFNPLVCKDPKEQKDGIQNPDYRGSVKHRPTYGSM